MDPETLAKEIQGLESGLAAETDAAKKAELQKTIDAKKSQHAQLLADEKNKVPYYKFQKTNDQLKDALAKLADIEAKEKAANEEKLKKDGELGKLIEQKDSEIKTLKTQLEQLIGEKKQSQVDAIILKQIEKQNPYDAEDLLVWIDQSKLKIVESDGSITVDGIDAELENIKKAKPHLFKTKKDDTRSGDENGKPSAGTLDSVEAEFKILAAKSALTPQEQARFRILGIELKKLRDAAAQKK